MNIYRWFDFSVAIFRELFIVIATKPRAFREGGYCDSYLAQLFDQRGLLKVLVPGWQEARAKPAQTETLRPALISRDPVQQIDPIFLGSLQY